MNGALLYISNCLDQLIGDSIACILLDRPVASGSIVGGLLDRLGLFTPSINVSDSTNVSSINAHMQ